MNIHIYIHQQVDILHRERKKRCILHLCIKHTRVYSLPRPAHPGLMQEKPHTFRTPFCSDSPSPAETKTQTHTPYANQKEKIGWGYRFACLTCFSRVLLHNPIPTPDQEKTKGYIKTRHFKTPQTPSLGMLQCKSRMGWMDTRE
jgi:hypothetical protein